MSREFKKVESYLIEYKLLKGKITDLELQLDELKDEYNGMLSMPVRERTSPTFKTSSPVENELINKEKEVEKLEYNIRLKKRLLARIDNALNTLNEKDRLFVEWKYILQMSHIEIANELNCSPEYITNKRKIIIDKLVKVLS